MYEVIIGSARALYISHRLFAQSYYLVFITIMRGYDTCFSPILVFGNGVMVSLSLTEIASVCLIECDFLVEENGGHVSATFVSFSPRSLKSSKCRIKKFWIKKEMWISPQIFYSLFDLYFFKSPQLVKLRMFLTISFISVLKKIVFENRLFFGKIFQKLSYS